MAELQLVRTWTGATLYGFLRVSHFSPVTYWIYNPCRLGTEMVALVSVPWLVHILLPVP